MKKTIIEYVRNKYDDQRAATEVIGEHLIIAYRDHNLDPQIDYCKIADVVDLCSICDKHPATEVRTVGGCTTAPHDPHHLPAPPAAHVRLDRGDQPEPCDGGRYTRKSQWATGITES